LHCTSYEENCIKNTEGTNTKQTDSSKEKTCDKYTHENLKIKACKNRSCECAYIVHNAAQNGSRKN